MPANFHRAAVILVAFAIAGAAAVWTGCGDDDVDKAVNQAQEKADKAAEDVKDAVPNDTEKKLNEAGEAVDTAKDKAESAVNDATGDDDAKKDDRGGKSGGGY